MSLDKILRFLKVDIWHVKKEDVSPLAYFAIDVVKKLILAVRFFVNKGVLDTASALTYSTLLAIVPIVAVVFAIARGFGFNKYIEQWFLDTLSSQPQAAEIIVGFVNSYLVHARSGVILGIGMVFMLWTVLMLIHNIELAFNRIWQVQQQRSLIRTVTDYISFFFLAPIIIVLTSGISIFITTMAKQTEEYLLLGPVVRFLIGLMPYVIMSCVFIGLYVLMPNTRVRLKYAIVPGILAGVAMQMLQLFYIKGQILLSSYNAIYGSFAALPLFMLWVQFSWTICLFGAQLCYTNQNLEEFAFLAKTDDISHRYRLLLSAMLMNRICKRQENDQKPYTAFKLKMETGIPIRITNDLLNDLVDVKLLMRSGANDKDKDPVYYPALASEQLTLGTMIDRLEAIGQWRLELDLHSNMEGDNWRKAIELRKDYLQQMRGMRITDLSV